MNLQLYLEDWQQAALLEMAQTRGMALEAMAQALLTERLSERSAAGRGAEHRSRKRAPRWQNSFTRDTLETRLKTLFED